SQVSTDPEKARYMLQQLGVQPERPLLLPVIGKILPDEPAEQAGFQPGDRILSAADRPIRTWEEWVEWVRDHPNTSFNVEIERGGERLILTLHPTAVQGEEGLIGHIGAAPRLPDKLPERLQATLRYSPWVALPQAVKKTWEIGSVTLLMVGK